MRRVGLAQSSCVKSVQRRRAASGAECRLGTVGGLQFVEDARDVILHGLEGHAERAGDLPVALAGPSRARIVVSQRGSWTLCAPGVTLSADVATAPS